MKYSYSQCETIQQHSNMYENTKIPIFGKRSWNHNFALKGRA